MRAAPPLFFYHRQDVVPPCRHSVGSDCDERLRELWVLSVPKRLRYFMQRDEG